MQDQNRLKKIALSLIEELGENTKRIGLKDTPRRMADMWREVFKGYDPTQMPDMTVFPNNEDGIVYDQIIIDQGRFHSYCVNGKTRISIKNNQHKLAKDIQVGDTVYTFNGDKLVEKIGRAHV